MKYLLRVDDRAHDEIVTALEAIKSPERSVLFRTRIQDIADTILEFPDAFPILKVTGVTTNLVVRRALILDFPYGLIYSVLPDMQVVRILKCYHTRSNPSDWFKD